jgi:hypothetical protein
MKLHDIFVALQTQTPLERLQENPLTRADLDFAKKKIVSSYRLLANASQSKAYQQFLTHCEQSLEASAERPMIDVLFSYLLEGDNRLINDITLCYHLTTLIQYRLQYQQEQLTLAPLGRVFIDRPVAFAAFIRSLLLNGVSAEQILASSLLQDFFRYYLSTLGEPENPVDQLYQMFQSFPETNALKILAHTVRCEEGGISSYALDGSTESNAARLTTIHPSVFAPTITPEVNNLTHLHALFGTDFLLIALQQWSTQAHLLSWTSTLDSIFNQPLVITTQLPLLLNRLQEYPSVQATLATILHHQTLATLVSQQVGGVFHLIPFCPFLMELLAEKNLKHYLQGLHQQASSGFALAACLMALFEGVRHTHLEAATWVFDALLDAIFDDPYVLEDAHTIQQLRKFSMARDHIKRKALTLEASLDRIILSQTTRPIEDLDIISIEDVWRSAAEKIKCLQVIEPFESSCPIDKYKLYGRIFAIFLKQLQKPMDMDTLTCALKIEPLFEVSQITLYERLLIEWLATIDHESLRLNCIQRLDAGVNRPWRTHPYGGLPLFKQGLLAGNVGLIQWLQTQPIKHLESYDAMTIIAAEKNQWAMVLHFHKQHPLTINTLNRLLHLAVTHKSSPAIQQLCSHMKSHSPNIKSIEQEFLLAIRHADLECVRCFLTSHRTPRDATLAKAFKQSILLNNHPITAAIATIISEKSFREVIGQLMMNAARLNQGDMLHYLATLTIHRPCQTAVESALLQATRSMQLQAVKLLMHWSPPPRFDAIQRAKAAAQKQPESAIADYLSDADEPHCESPSKKRRSKDHGPIALKRALSCNHIGVGTLLKNQGFFKSDTPEIQPSSTGITRQISMNW